MLKRISAVVATLSLAFATPVFAGEYDNFPKPMQLYIKAQRLVSYQKYDEAILLYLEAHKTTKDEFVKRMVSTGVLHAHLSAGFFSGTDSKEVIQHLSKALEIQQDIPNAWEKKGLAHCELKQHSQCDAAITMAIKHAPPKYKHFVLWTRATTRADMGRAIPAAQDFKNAIQMAIQHGDTKSAEGFALSAKTFGININ